MSAIFYGTWQTHTHGCDDRTFDNFPTLMSDGICCCKCNELLNFGPDVCPKCKENVYIQNRNDGIYCCECNQKLDCNLKAIKFYY